MGICISCDGGFIQDEEAAHVGLEYRNDVVLYVSDIKHGGAPLAVGSLTSHQGSKGLNQDSAILHQGYGGSNGAFCGVFDGHGKNGHFVSEMVRNRLPSLILNQKNALKGEGEDDVSLWKQFFTSAFNAMDKEMKLRESMDCSLSGTTAVVVVKQGDDLYIANLGDSRAVLGTMTMTTTTEKRITAKQLTTDLKPGLPDEAERIRKWKGRVFALEAEPHVQRVWMPEDNYPGLAMSRSFGDLDLKQHGVISTPLVTHHRLSPQDRFLVLATDGVWDVMSNDEVAGTVWGASTEAEAAQELVVKARKAWVHKFPSAKIDDCTALCLFFHGREILD